MGRSTQAQMHERYDAILAFCEDQHPVTVRGIYYHLTTKALVPKTQAGYQKVANACKKLRLDGSLPWHYIADNTRWRRVYTTFHSIEAALENTAKTYRRDALTFAGVAVEIWCEKDALSGVFTDVTLQWDVPLMVSRGFSSLSFLQSSAQELPDGASVYIFSDFDASGEIIYKKIKEGLHQFAPDKTIHVSRAMLDREHIELYNLPTRDPKPRDKKQGYEFCCELDAVPPNILRAHVEACITEHISVPQLVAIRQTENAEKESIRSIFAHHYEAQNGEA